MNVMRIPHGARPIPSFGAVLLWGALLVVFPSGDGARAFVPPYSIADLTRLSTDIVVGEVIGSESAWEDWKTGRVILTTLQVRVEQALKGANDGLIRVVVPGGTVDRITMAASCAPHYTIGRRAALFLVRDDESPDRFFVFGLERGYFDFAGETLSAQASDLPALSFEAFGGEVARTLAALEKSRHPSAPSSPEKRK